MHVFSGSSVIVWKQTHRIISAGSRLIRKDSRMKLVRTNTGGISLRIDNVSQDDRGNKKLAVNKVLCCTCVNRKVIIFFK